MAEEIVMQPGHNAITAAWAAIPDERRAIILAGEAAIMNRRRAFDDWVAVGRAFLELQLEAMRQSNSGEPKGRRYGDAYELLELPPEIANLHKIDKSDRAKIIWLYENEAPVRHWYETLGQNQRDRWTHPQTIKLHFEKRTAKPGDPAASKPPTPLEEQKAEVVRLQGELDDAAKRIRTMERGRTHLTEGRDWSWQDDAKDIAAAWFRLYPTKAVQAVSELLRLAKATTPKPGQKADAAQRIILRRPTV